MSYKVFIFLKITHLHYFFVFSIRRAILCHQQCATEIVAFNICINTRLICILECTIDAMFMFLSVFCTIFEACIDNISRPCDRIQVNMHSCQLFSLQINGTLRAFNIFQVYQYFTIERQYILFIKIWRAVVSVIVWYMQLDL